MYFARCCYYLPAAVICSLLLLFACCCYLLAVAVICSLLSFAHCYHLLATVIYSLLLFAHCYYLLVAIVCSPLLFAHCSTCSLQEYHKLFLKQRPGTKLKLAKFKELAPWYLSQQKQESCLCKVTLHLFMEAVSTCFARSRRARISHATKRH